MLVDGLSKSEAPGSLWDPAHTSFSIAGLGELGLSFGLFMAGVSGSKPPQSIVYSSMFPSFPDMQLFRLWLGI